MTSHTHSKQTYHKDGGGGILPKLYSASIWCRAKSNILLAPPLVEKPNFVSLWPGARKFGRQVRNSGSSIMQYSNETSQRKTQTRYWWPGNCNFTHPCLCRGCLTGTSSACFFYRARLMFRLRFSRACVDLPCPDMIKLKKELSVIESSLMLCLICFENCLLCLALCFCFVLWHSSGRVVLKSWLSDCLAGFGVVSFCE